MKLQNITLHRVIIGISFIIMLLLMTAWNVRKHLIRDEPRHQINIKISKIDIAISY